MNFNFKNYSDTEVIIEIAVLSKLESENARLREALELILKIGEYSSCEVAYTALEGE